MRNLPEICLRTRKICPPPNPPFQVCQSWLPQKIKLTLYDNNHHKYYVMSYYLPFTWTLQFLRVWFSLHNTRELPHLCILISDLLCHKAKIEKFILDLGMLMYHVFCYSSIIFQNHIFSQNHYYNSEDSICNMKVCEIWHR